jgi:TonB-dependent SusC/RagA subfamily outer membrane receptor
MKRICTQTLILLLCAVLPAFLVAQKNTYSGKILDGDLNEALIGVNIIVKNTAQGTVSDFEGMYQIQAATGDTLVFSYLGYQTYQLALNNQLINNVTLMPDLKVLDEVVVIGYGTVKKSDLTGSVASVKAEDIVKVPAANPLQALQGKVSGLQVMSVSGDPGASPVLRLRGITTFNNNDPLVVIDGVLSNISTASLLNANDIESIEVLKDASSIAIFGSRGAAGVILISTKKGQPGKN